MVCKDPTQSYASCRLCMHGTHDMGVDGVRSAGLVLVEHFLEGSALAGGHVLVPIVVAAVVAGVAVEHAVHAHDQLRPAQPCQRMKLQSLLFRIPLEAARSTQQVALGSFAISSCTAQTGFTPAAGCSAK